MRLWHLRGWSPDYMQAPLPTTVHMQCENLMVIDDVRLFSATLRDWAVKSQQRMCVNVC